MQNVTTDRRRFKLGFVKGKSPRCHKILRSFVLAPAIYCFVYCYKRLFIKKMYVLTKITMLQCYNVKNGIITWRKSKYMNDLSLNYRINDNGNMSLASASNK